MPKSYAIAGVGSRETPPDILTEMRRIGEWCRFREYIVRSGHAPGADQAFEAGAKECGISYLPWSSFEAKAPIYGLKVVFKGLPQAVQVRMIAIAAAYHPWWPNLKDTTRLFMARNSCQIMGHGPKDDPVKAVVCWTKDGGPTGGTGQAIRVAVAYKIPVINLFFRGWKFEKITAELERLLA